MARAPREDKMTLPDSREDKMTLPGSRIEYGSGTINPAVAKRWEILVFGDPPSDEQSGRLRAI